MVIKRYSESNRGRMASYGLAMSSLFVVHELQAEVLDITWNGGAQQVTFDANADVDCDIYNLRRLDIDQVPGSTSDFFVFNTYFPNAKTMMDFFCRSFGVYTDQEITGVAQVFSGDVLDPDTFSGMFNIDISGPLYAGFRTPSGNVGWFKIEISGSEALVFGIGEYGTEGETLTVGGKKELLGDVNCDGFVNLLDVEPFIELLKGMGGYSSKADCNEDGELNLLDVEPFIAILGGG